MTEDTDMSTPCPPSSTDRAADCNGRATDLGLNVLRFPIERCRRRRPAPDRWAARRDRDLAQQTIAGQALNDCPREPAA